MASLTVREREHRKKVYANQWVPSKVFPARRLADCAACDELIVKGQDVAFRRWESLGAGQQVHVGCIDK